MTITSEKLNGSSIVRKNARIATLTLSICAYVPQSPLEHARRLVYEEAVLSGAGKYTRQEWLDVLGKLGSEISVTSESGFINLTVHTIDTSLKKTLDICTLLFSFPTFSDTEILRIKKNLKNTLTLAKENSSAYAYQKFVATFFSKNDRRMQYPLDVLIEEIDRVKKEDLRTLHTSFWNYTWLFTYGGSNTSCELIEKTVSKIFRLNRGTSTYSYLISNPMECTKTSILLHNIPNKQNIDFSIGNTLSLTRAHHDFPALALGINILGLAGGFAGRLMSTVREKEGLTYGIYARIEDTTSDECGLWRISTFFAPKDVVRGITSTLREISNICEKGITTDELKRFKTIMHTRSALIEDSLVKKVGEAHALKKMGISDRMYTQYKNDIQSLRVTDVNHAMRTYINPSHILISGAGPTKVVEKDLQRFSHI